MQKKFLKFFLVIFLNISVFVSVYSQSVQESKFISTILPITNLSINVKPPEARIDIYDSSKNLFKREFIEDGAFSINLPDGKYTVVIQKGYEYEPYREEIDIREGSIKKLEVELKKIYDMEKLGWYCGDTHMHTTFSDGSQKFPVLIKAAKAEGLNWIVTTEHNEGCIKAWKHLYKFRDNYNTPYFNACFGEEVTTFHSGHFNALFVEGYVNYLLPLKEIIKETHKYNGLISANHPFFGVNLQEGDMGSYFTQLVNGWAEFEEELDGIEVWNGKWCWENEEALRYYFHNILNKGYKFFAIAGTDTHNFYSAPCGTPRTYVYLGDKKLSCENIKKSIKEGKIFLTNAPLVLFDIRGKIPGEELEVKKGEKVNFNIEIKSIYNLSHFFIIKNGSPCFYRNIKGKKEHSEKVTLSIDRDSWYILRVYGEGETQAITNPVWVKTK